MHSLPDCRGRMARLPFLLLLLLSSTLAAAQTPQPVQQPDQPSSHRRRIGLALSGGSALGLAEIGVLQWLEQNHIPVDRVAGTSMGGIIGAMYASGMSPAEIQKFAESIDWDEAMLPEPTYRESGIAASRIAATTRSMPSSA